jgi:hypothetical protein
LRWGYCKDELFGQLDGAIFDFFRSDHIFDYDAYKILVNFLRDNEKQVRLLTDDEAEEIMKRFSG